MEPSSSNSDRERRTAQMREQAKQGNERLRESLRTLGEVESMAGDTAEELSNQRATIEKIRGNVNEMDQQQVCGVGTIRVDDCYWPIVCMLSLCVLMMPQDLAEYRLKRMNGFWSRVASWFKGPPQTGASVPVEGLQNNALRQQVRNQNRKDRTTNSHDHKFQVDRASEATGTTEHLRSQDNHLDEIERSLDRLSERGHAIRDEVDYQNNALDDVSSQVNHVDRRLDKNTRHARRLAR